MISPEKSDQPRRGTSTRDDELVALVKAGATLAQAGSHFGISRERTRQILRKKGITVAALPGRTQARSARRLRDRLLTSGASVEELWRAGRTRAEIAIELGLAQAAVRELLCERVTREERLAIAAQKRGEMRRLPDQAVLDTLREAARILGRCPSARSYDRLRASGRIQGLSATAVSIRFGWATACRTVGLTPNPSSASGGCGPRVYSDANLHAALSRVARMLGRSPTLRDYEAHRQAGEPSATAIRLRYGGWDAARRGLLP